MNDNNIPPPSLDTWTSFFLLAAGQGIFLACVLFFHKKGNRRANALLGAFVLFFALSLVDYVGFWTRYNMYFPKLRAFYEYLIFFFGPLIFLYFKSVYGKNFSRFDWLHFTGPLGFLLLRRLKWWEWLPTERPFLDGQAIIFISHLLCYGIASWLFLSKIAKPSVIENSGQATHRGWHFTLLALYFGFILGWIVYFLLTRTPYFTLFHDYSISLAMTIFIYAVGYLGFRQPEIFSGKTWPQVFQPQKYQSSSLTPSAAKSLLEKLTAHMETEKPYLDNDLRITHLSEILDVSIHHLSQVINENLGKSFPEFVNEYRVEAARKMLANPAFSDQFVIDIAYASGFNNKTSFNKAFKQQTGLSPTQFRKMHASNGQTNQNSKESTTSRLSKI